MRNLCRRSYVRLSAVPLAAALALAGCGSSTQSSSHTGTRGGSADTTPALVSSAAEHPRAAQFPQAAGRSLRELAALVHGAATFGPATGTYTPGVQRVGFAVTTDSGGFIYAPTALYIARNPNTPAKGPFPAPADPMGVAPPYRSNENTGPEDLQAIYAARVPVPKPGTYTVLSITRTRTGLVGAPGEIAVAAASPIPAVGQRPPAIATDTPATVHGNTALLTTRIPPDDMHAVSFDRVLGRRPIALLFSTPQLCVSKVCGPVTDIGVSLERQFGSRIAFIHEEVYVGNDPKKGLRPQLKAFHLRTEPWLFTVNRRGVIAARLEGAFGVNEFRQALEAALR